MKLLHPLARKSKSGVLWVVLVIHESPRQCGGFCIPGPEYYELLAILDTICQRPRRLAMVCNTLVSSGDTNPLAVASGLIRSGEVDLVVAGDVSRFSQSAAETTRFLTHCVEHRTRVITFADGIDTADKDWQEALLAAIALSQEGGAE